jgi:hypothetical protein
MPRPHDPTRARCISDLMRELRKRHTINPRRMYARRVDIFGPVVVNPQWFLNVAARWMRRHKEES